MILYILTEIFLDSTQEEKRIWTGKQQASPELNLLSVLSMKYD